MVSTESLLAFAAISLVVIAMPGWSILCVVGRALAAWTMKTGHDPAPRTSANIGLLVGRRVLAG
ncbi:hypothetical protein GCM10015535_33190 [Streptomyces gelaticus]|uniref:Uncharacterized protein n=1 Tax=Streptomyces gelaticus TaxID=285446 RepID=A0ABQ2W2N9_9ACTN|nr:hypothetical protein GCM10015535_33190 [Streptomyces gelaticus]